jgi:glycosidase
MMKKLLKLLLPVMLATPFFADAQRTFKKMTPEEIVAWECDHRVFYQIFVRSFADSNGDGIGDLNGITGKLDYLADLGIGGLWLTPFQPAPSYHKYDPTDYQDVDPQHGNLDDFRRLVEEAHRRNIYVLLDLVANHSSSQHPWFKAAVRNDPSFRDYYSWENEPPLTTEGGWYLPRDENGKEFGEEKYYGFFWRGMPDLNYNNPAVRMEMTEIARWWLLETGVDGFRLDAAQHIYQTSSHNASVAWWKEFTDSLKKTKPNLITIGECWNKTENVAPYTAALTGVFNFEVSWQLMKCLKEETHCDLAGFVKRAQASYALHDSNYIDPIFLSNHDNNRILSELDNNEAKARLAATILFTLPGTPFIYYGEEIGMKGMKPDSLIREPFLWDEKKKDPLQTHWEKAVFSTAKQVRPLSKQVNDSSSIFRYYKKLIKTRRVNEALAARGLEPLDLGDPSLLAYRRTGQSQKLMVIHNLSGIEKSFSLGDSAGERGQLIFSSSNHSTHVASSVLLAPYSSVIIQMK